MEGMGAPRPNWDTSEVRVSRPRKKAPVPTSPQTVTHRGSGCCCLTGRGSGTAAWSPWKWLLLSNYYTPRPALQAPTPEAQPGLHTPTDHLGGMGSPPGPAVPLSRTPGGPGGEWGGMWMDVGSPALTLHPLPCLAEAQQGHDGPQTTPQGRCPPGEGRGGPHRPGSRSQPLTGLPPPPPLPPERHAADRGHRAGEGGEPQGDREAELPVGALPPAAHPRLHRRAAGTHRPPRFPHRSGRQARGVRAGQGAASGWPSTRPHPPRPPQELCKQLHAKVDAAEEEKYDMEVKVQKSSKEVRGRGARGAAGAAGGLAPRLLPSPPLPCSWRT